MARDEARLPDAPGYQIAMLTLSLFAVGALAARTAVQLKPDTSDILEYVDLGVCVVFFGDFLWSLWRAPNRGKYFLTWGWLDLLSSVPAVDALRWGRMSRVVRILRVLRGLRAAKLIASAILRRRAQNTFLAVSLVAFMLLVFSSIAILHFEATPDSNIKGAEDALWWSFVTITTVGYGDRFPVTPEGRFIAAMLMAAGVGLFGTFSGFLASWFLSPGQPKESEIESLHKEMALLRAQLTRFSDLSAKPTAAVSPVESRPEQPEHGGVIAGQLAGSRDAPVRSTT